MSPTPPHPDEAALQADDDSHKATLRRTRWIVLGSLGLLFALALGAFLLDEPPSDTADLAIPRINPPEDQNAYALLTKLVATLPPEPAEHDPDEVHYTRIFEDKVAWNSAVVATVLGRYPPTLRDSVRAALDAPETEAPAINSYSDLLPEVGRFRALAFTLTRQATLAWRTGDHARAADLNLLVLELGTAVSRSGGPIITVLTGTAIQGIALASIQRHADADSAPAAVLQDYLARLRTHELRIQDYHTAYRLEHHVFANTARDLQKIGLSGLVGAKPRKSLDLLLALPGVWQPNRTIRWHAEFIRVHTKQVEPLPPGATDPVASGIEALVDAPWPGRARNFAGRTLLAITLPSLSTITTTCHRARANLRLTELYLALRLHHLQTGELPADLAPLVPRHLPTLPLDPFDGQALRYDRALSTIWSTDQDRRAVTSAEGELPRRMPAYRLLFARTPAPLPAFAEFTATEQQSPPEAPAPENSPGETPPADVSPAK
jgi:hypothetical protein